MPVKLCHFCFCRGDQKPTGSSKMDSARLSVIWGHNTGSSLNLGAFYITFDSSISVTWLNKQKKDLKMVMYKL